MREKKNVSVKTLALLLALVLLIGCVAGGTVAWLIAESKTVTNTFVAGKIGTLTLTETDDDKQYVVTPGYAVEKDPQVSYTPTGTNDVAVYVFVKVSGNGWSYNSTDKVFETENGELSFAVDSAWTYLSDGVYYTTVAAGDSLAATSIIEDDTISVVNTLTTTNIDGVLSAANLTFTAYAIQQDGFNGSAAAAWAALNP